MDRPGYKTTEFWLSTSVIVLGTLLASGAISDGGMVAKIVGGLMDVLGALGYTFNRTSLKKAAADPEVLK